MQGEYPMDTNKKRKIMKNTEAIKGSIILLLILLYFGATSIYNNILINSTKNKQLDTFKKELYKANNKLDKNFIVRDEISIKDLNGNEIVIYMIKVYDIREKLNKIIKDNKVTNKEFSELENEIIKSLDMINKTGNYSRYK